MNPRLFELSRVFLPPMSLNPIKKPCEGKSDTAFIIVFFTMRTTGGLYILYPQYHSILVEEGEYGEIFLVSA